MPLIGRQRLEKCVVLRNGHKFAKNKTQAFEIEYSEVCDQLEKAEVVASLCHRVITDQLSRELLATFSE
jgi:hypothetical protein